MAKKKNTPAASGDNLCGPLPRPTRSPLQLMAAAVDIETPDRARHARGGASRARRRQALDRG
jgi:hypothetical protein